MNSENISNGEWLWKRYDRLLRPENTPDNKYVIELEWRECDECNDKWGLDNVENGIQD